MTTSSIAENRLFRGEHRVLRIAGAKFQSKIGWSPVMYVNSTRHALAAHESSSSRSIFDLLGFPLKPTGTTDEMALQPADIDPSTSEGKRTRAKLLRAWVELNSYIATFYRSKTSKYLHLSTERY